MHAPKGQGGFGNGGAPPQPVTALLPFLLPDSVFLGAGCFLHCSPGICILPASSDFINKKFQVIKLVSMNILCTIMDIGLPRLVCRPCRITREIRITRENWV
jgi:hypothetical protein